MMKSCSMFWETLGCQGVQKAKMFISWTGVCGVNYMIFFFIFARWTFLR